MSLRMSEAAGALKCLGYMQESDPNTFDKIQLGMRRFIADQGVAGLPQMRAAGSNINIDAMLIDGQVVSTEQRLMAAGADCRRSGNVERWTGVGSDLIRNLVNRFRGGDDSTEAEPGGTTTIIRSSTGSQISKTTWYAIGGAGVLLALVLLMRRRKDSE